jgi:hypothetical protein
MISLSETAVLWMFGGTVLIASGAMFATYSLAKLVITQSSVIDDYRRQPDSDGERTWPRSSRLVTKN